MGVTVIGSFSDDKAFSQLRMTRMMHDTTEASIDKLHELITGLTPVGLDHTVNNPQHSPGHLKRSIKTKGPTRVAKNIWRGEVFSNEEYAAAIEYGMPRKPIVPKTGGKLAFIGRGGNLVVVPAAPKWGGYDGAHMFSKGEAAFERHWAERIAKNKARLWLGAVDAGLRVGVI